jgi:N-methylhydantoinase A
VVRGAAPEAALGETRTAYMRYIGQGHEIAVDLPVRTLSAQDGALLREAFDAAYTALYGRTIPGLDIEVLSWTVTVATKVAAPLAAAVSEAVVPSPEPAGRRSLFDPQRADSVSVPVYRRAALGAGTCVEGPALIVEDQTTTVVAEGFTAAVNDLGYITMVRRGEKEHPR